MMATPSSLDDFEAVRLARDGDSSAAGLLYSRYFDCVYDFLLRTMRDPSAAEDAAQDTFVKALRSLDTLESVESFKNWLFTIARRTALNYVRQGRSTLSLSTGEPDLCDFDVVDDDRMVDPQAAAEAAALRTVVWRAAAGLDPANYMVLDMHLRQGFDSPEIAAALGISRNHAAVKLNRVKASMRRSVLALYMLQTGREACAGLNSELGSLDEREFSPGVRKQIERHTAQCGACHAAELRVVSPEAVFSALAVVPVGVNALPTILTALGLGAAAGGAAGAAGAGAAVSGAAGAGGTASFAPIAVAAAIAALAVGSVLAVMNPFGGPDEVAPPAIVAAAEPTQASSTPAPTLPPVTIVAGVVTPGPAAVEVLPALRGQAPESSPPAAAPPGLTPAPTAPAPAPTGQTPAPTASPRPTVAPVATPPATVIAPVLVVPQAPPPPTATPTATAAAKAPPSPTATPSPTVTPSPTAMPSPTPTATPSPIATPQAKAAAPPTAPPTATPSPTGCLPPKAQGKGCPHGQGWGGNGNGNGNGGSSKNGKWD